MSQQEYINILIGLVSVLGGWLFKGFSDKLEELKTVDRELVTQLSRIEILIASDYVKKYDLEKSMDIILAKLDKVETIEVTMAEEYVKKGDLTGLTDRIFRKLDRIEEKIDKKADKN
jgi:hypothetical protein